jgi:DNA primase
MTVISEIKSRLDIVELVSAYVTLQKSGRNFKAPCPFHAEKQPSFYVFPDRQSWHCFGACNTGGDIFSFVMKKENAEFGEALRLLAEKAGVRLEPVTPQRAVEDEQRLRLIQMNEAAATFFHHQFLNAAAAGHARRYLEKRGVNAESLRAFRIGYSLEGWETLREYLTGKGYSEKELVEGGLLIAREGGGGAYDRFRNRLMFPICDVQGKVIGFGGRELDGSVPKYMNSPQTPVFDKSGVLYGIDQARDAIRALNLAILVEGYMDVILPHQYGERNVVASMGIALTEKQLNLLKRLTRNVALALDADAAGEEAMLRIAAVGESMGKDVVAVPTWTGLIRYENTLDAEIKVVVLPPGKDPDEVILADVKQWRELVGKASPIVDYALEVVSRKADLTTAKGKSDAATKLVPLIREIKDPVRQAHYVQKLGRLLKTDERALWIAVNRAASARPQPLIVRQAVSPAPARLISPAKVAVEEYFLSLVLQFPELRTAAEVPAEYFTSTENRAIWEGWLAANGIDDLRSRLDTYLVETLDQLLERRFPPAVRDSPTERRHTYNDFCLSLKMNWVRAEKALHAQSGDTDLSDEVSTLKHARQIKEIYETRRSERRSRRLT